MPLSYIGEILAFSATAPSTNDAAGFGALTFTVVAQHLNATGFGIEHGKIESTALTDGITKTTIGAAKPTPIEVQCRFVHGDAGQNLIRASNGTNAQHSLRRVVTAGAVTVTEWAQGVVSDFKNNDSDNPNEQGFTFMFTPNFPFVRTAA